jgi:nucleotide-binding universal stress UspA family protein
MKVLLATDGSPSSDAAVDEVARRLWPPDTQVRIISVVEACMPLAAEPYMQADYLVVAEKALRIAAQEAVDHAATKLRKRGNLQITTEVLTGSPKRLIVEESENWGADLIVVGSQGYRTWERMLLGSVSQAVATHAECSVEVVRRRV